MESFSIGILSFHSKDTLINTLTSYHDNGLLHYCDDVNIWYQEITEEDRQIANHFSINAIGSSENIGIGKAFLELAKKAKHDTILLLEHDWLLIEPIETVVSRLSSGMMLLNSGYDYVRYRHRKDPGYPHFSIRHYANPEQALVYHDPEIDMTSPHLLDAIHWSDQPEIEYRGRIGKQTVDTECYYVASSRYANWTNNPCLFKREFYLSNVRPFAGNGIDLEGKISHWWARQRFNVAHGEGLFKHVDRSKYGDLSL